MLEKETQQFTKADGVSLRDYMEAKLAAQERATEIARLAMEKRLEGMNEFRDALRDQNSTFIPRAECRAMREKIEDALRKIELSDASLAGKASQASVTNAQILAIVGVVIGVVGIILGVLHI